MNFPTNKPSQGGVGNAGGVGIGVLGAPPAQTLTVGEIGFGPCWQDDEPSLREMYDAACATIIRMECEADELRAEVALLQEQARIMRRDLDGYRDAACREKCRDKAAADGGWSNI